MIDTDRVLAGSSLAEAAKPFLSRAQLEEVGIRPEDHTSFQLSANQKYVAFATHSQKIFRRSKDAEYVVVRVENGRYVLCGRL